jgi:branched-subunit amino acid aminotransferase/4-amino-4-deoxychorismate lyase
MTITCYHLTPDGITLLDLPALTLDEMTRALPPGFYTTFATLGGGTRVLGLQSHLRRLYIPARESGLHPVLDETVLRQYIAELAKKNLPGESRLRLILTRETGAFYAGVEPFTPLPPAVYENGVRVVTTDLARHNPHIKDTNFIAQSLAQRQRVSKDVFEVLLTKNGRILEGMTSNFYAVTFKQHATRPSPTQVQPDWQTAQETSRGTIVTARYGILPGVTRRIVLRLARRQGLHIEYRPPRVDEVFDEAFLTSSSRGVVPIIAIDGRVVGDGRVGEVSKILQKLYQAYILKRAETIIADPSKRTAA